MEKVRISVFIDQANLWNSSKNIGKVFDYSKFRDFFEAEFSGEVKHIFFYQAYPKDGTRDYSTDNLHKFFVKLEKGFAFTVRKKPLKTITLRDKEGSIIYDQRTGKPATIEKGNFDVELTIDAQKYMNDYDVGLFFSGDSDFLPLINFLKSNGKRICIFSTEDCVSKELKSSGNKYYDLSDCNVLHGDDLKSKTTK